MSAFPVMLDAARIRAVVVGAGSVGTRRATALLEAGARVRVVAPSISADLREAAGRFDTLELIDRSFATTDLDGATLAFAATNDAAVNAAVASAADARGLLVNVADDPDRGSFVTPAVHRAGDIVVGVSAGRLPAAARRIRDRIAHFVDDRYRLAVGDLASMRRSMLDDSRRDEWRKANEALIGDDFCESVESGELRERMATWR